MICSVFSYLKKQKSKSTPQLNSSKFFKGFAFLAYFTRPVFIQHTKKWWPTRERPVAGGLFIHEEYVDGTTPVFRHFST